MERIADDVHALPLAPRRALNAYLVGDVLVDAGLKFHGEKILDRVRSAGITLAAHVLTHAHVDHAGGTARILREADIPVSVGTLDREACETGNPPLGAAMRKPLLDRLAGFIGSFDGFDVDATISEGDEIGCGFVAVDTPGHTAGHVAFWREADRVLISGDVLTTMHLVTGKPGLHEPPGTGTVDPRRNRDAIRRVADLEPDVVLPGHGPPLRDAAAQLRAFADGLA